MVVVCRLDLDSERVLRGKISPTTRLPNKSINLLKLTHTHTCSVIEGFEADRLLARLDFHSSHVLTSNIEAIEAASTAPNIKE